MKDNVNLTYLNRQIMINDLSNEQRIKHTHITSSLKHLIPLMAYVSFSFTNEYGTFNHLKFKLLLRNKCDAICS